MKLLFIFLLFPFLSQAQKDSGFRLYAGSTIYSTHSKNGVLLDSSSENKYFVFNSKKVPEKGLYMDSVLWVDPYGKFYIISAFMNQQLVLNVSQYVRKGSVNIPDIFIDKKYKLKP